MATGVATAGGLAIYDAWYDGPDSTESIRSEPYVDARSDEFAAGFAQYAALHPLPLGADYDQLYGNTLAAGGLKQVSGAAGQIVMVSICAWSSEWLRAHDARDNQAEQAEQAEQAAVLLWEQRQMNTMMWTTLSPEQRKEVNLYTDHARARWSEDQDPRLGSEDA